MGTYYSPPAILGIYEDVKGEDADNFGHLALGGIMGDSAHFSGGGYHVPRSYLAAHMPGDYSIQLPPDREGDPLAASAIDLTPATQDGQHLLTRRLLDATAANDDRLHPIREWAGSLDSQNVTARSLRPDLTDVSSSFDSGHLWHVHISILRKFANDTQALAGVADVLAGVPAEGHNNGGGGSTHTPDGAGHHRYGTAPKWPLKFGYFGLESGPRNSHGGATAHERRGVRRIQRRLTKLGYPATVDGRFGPATAAAVARWQHATRAAVTTRPGEVWRDDWRALFTWRS